MKIAHLASQILHLDPQANPARLAFYHYIKNFCDLQAEFTPEILDRFYDHALLFQQWRSNTQELGQQVSQILEKCARGLDLTGEFARALHAHEIQWLDIAQDRDFDALLKEENQKFEKRNEKVKMIPFGRAGALRIRLDIDCIRVEVKPRLAYLDGSQVRLVRPSSQLVYNTDLELQSEADHFLQISPLNFARFRSDGHIYQGQLLQGASFARTESFKDQLENLPELFWALKKIEKHYINPVTDSSYLILMEEIEIALSALKKFHPNREILANQALRKAELYRENVFPDDRSLNTLVSELKYRLRRDDAEESERCQNLSPLPNLSV